MTETKQWDLNPLYLIYSDGRIFSIRANKFLKNNLDRYGYVKSTLYSNKQRIYSTNHRLVAQAFIPNPENKVHVNHKNGIKTDNRVENLEWVSAKENIDHSIINGLKKSVKSWNQYNSKLKVEEVRFIRRLWDLQMSQTEISKIVGHSYKLIHKVVNNKSYKDVN